MLKLAESRLKEVNLHEKQKEIVQKKARFKVIRAGRRFGKTLVETETMLFKAVSKAVLKALEGKNRNVLYIAPTQKQARSIIWEAFKSRLKGVGDFNESRLEIKVPDVNGNVSTIFIGGWENRENYRGMPNVYHITFDELDTMKDFFISWQEIFRPMLIDTGGTADFIGTPKKENPNLRRLEKEFADKGEDFAAFHYKTSDNPFIDPLEIEKARRDMDKDTFKQEILGEHIDNEGALFRYASLLDMFSNTVTKTGAKYLLVDIADDGSDKTIFSFWEDLEMYRVEVFERLNTEGIINQIREYASAERIPYSHIAVDAIGVGAGVASSSMLDGIVGYKSSYQAIKTDIDPVRLPNVHYTKDAPLVSDYKNLRSQCVFTLAQIVNDHKIACRVQDVRIKEKIIEELSSYQDVSKGDGKRMATAKEDIREALGRSPDITDTMIMRMYFVIKGKMLPDQGEEVSRIHEQLASQFERNKSRMGLNSSK